MSFDETSLQGNYDLLKLSVSSSTQISSRTSAIARHLESSSGSSSGHGKTTIIALTASSKATNKLISIVEIAKRDFLAKADKVFQYNALSYKLEEIPRKPKVQAEGDSDDAFEVVGAEGDTGMVKRNVPVLTVYLAKVSVKGLKMAYGEQA